MCRVRANDRRIWLQLRDLFPHPYHLADAEAYISRVGAEDPPRSLAIVIDGRVIGGVGLQLMTDVNRRSAEIGYWLGAAYWGRGIATEAVALVTSESSPSRSPETWRREECSRKRGISWKVR